MTVNLTETVQHDFTYYKRRGYFGDIARPNDYPIFDSLTSAEDDGLVPGDGVSLDGYGKAVRPSHVLDESEVIGIVSFNQNDVPTSGVSDILYKSGSIVKIGVRGTFWGKAGETLKYGDIVKFDYTEKDWRKFDLTDVDGDDAEELFGDDPDTSVYGKIVANGDGVSFTAGVKSISIDGIPVEFYTSSTTGEGQAADLENALHAAGFVNAATSGSETGVSVSGLSSGYTGLRNQSIVVDTKSIESGDSVAIRFNGLKR